MGKKPRKSKAEIGAIIRNARLIKGMSMTELGKRTGYVHQPAASFAVGRWETGVLYVPTEKLRDVSEALDIPLESLIP